ncbi:formate--tetrahydrofolate ligase [Corynebacterium otitidis]|uniref:formate--tetrahydrofolate ligase n=1 Tax=Corynebacterium otitidis TaxID=29321 RepID=UPI0006278C7C|nr:formate--tetrahydrofolate ligase [Corynebacterium otitidis]KKO84582.1 formate--tetrahydrofolate ligase [Corynebacterium otitidis]
MALSDVEIAQNHKLEPIEDIAKRAGIPDDAFIPYGGDKAKVDASRVADQPRKGKLILVTGMSPTPAGEGKSTTLIGLADAFTLEGKNAIAAIREPSQGPVMGVKGGAAGGGYSQVVPMEDINLHFTGDFHAITAANNTLASIIDNHIHQGNELNIDPRQVTWQRCVDVNDRALRHVVVGLGGPTSGVPRQDGFTITAASEIMAVVGLATSLSDLKERIGNINIGLTYDKKPVTVRELKAEGALTVLLKDTINPNLVQTLGGTPAYVHGGPFANIAHGCNTLLATDTALRTADYVFTEAGFGADLGAEKFFDIKARFGDLSAAGAVIVATIRSLKYNGGVAKDDLNEENLDALKAGLPNLERHIENLRKFGVEPVVALNLFPIDSDKEREFMAKWAEDFGVALSESKVWAEGGEGARDLAKKVLDNLGEGSKQLYDPEEGVEATLNTIAKELYHADKVVFTKDAKKDLKKLKDNGWDKLPVCVSKNQFSFSDDASELGAPEGHTLTVRELQPRTGAGFVVALTGNVMTMPGLPKKPSAEKIDIDEEGKVVGLF